MEKLDGEGIPIAQPKLDMLTRASMIQKMFYTDNSHAPTLNFTLTPMDFSSNVSRFILNIGGKMLSFEPGIKPVTQASWPGSDGNFITISL